MRSTTIAMLGMLMIGALGACLSDPEDVRESDPEAVVADDAPAPEVGTSTAAVVAGCTAKTTCSGTKTCGAWSTWSTCGASYQRCDESCGFPTRWGCNVKATVSPQNRTRSCVMHATGATCVETDYREVVVSCPAG